MRILILGAGGMLGHKLCLSYRERYETWATVRSTPSLYMPYNLIQPERLLGGVDAFNIDSVIRVLGTVQPDVVINCIGIIKQLPNAKNPLVSLTINSLFPHRLANLCRATAARLIHISTDCVFSGRKGMYTEEDLSDAEDLYGRTKFLGEVTGAGSLTLRTSIIGRELRTTSSLIEWFLSNKGNRVRGYSNAIYSGFTTLALAQMMANVIEDYPQLSGLYHLSSEPINKYDLLTLIADTLALPIEIEPNPDIQIDRSLNSDRFWSEVDFTPPSWSSMIQAMADDPTPYDLWRKNEFAR